MRNLEYIVNGQKLQRYGKCNFDDIVMGTANYLQCTFSFDKEWKGTKKIAVFSNHYEGEVMAVPIEDDRVLIPKEICAGETIVVYVLGTQKDGLRIITNKDIIYQKGV